MGSDCGDQRQWGKDFDPVEALLLLSPFSCWRMIEGPYKDFPEGDGRGRAGHSLVHLDQKKDRLTKLYLISSFIWLQFHAM